MGEIITASVPFDAGKAEAAPAAAAAGAPAAAVVEGGAKPAADGAPKDGTGAVAPAAADGAAVGADGKPAAASTPVNPSELVKKEEPVKNEEQVRAEAATGLDLTPFAQEWDSTGKLSDESYAKLGEKGLNKATVDIYIRGLQAQVSERLTSYADTVGGVDNFNAIITWGKTGLSEGERTEAARVLSGTNAESAKIFLAGLQAKFVAANGKVPGKIAGGGGAPAPDVFNSRAEQAKAMRDPRYKSDPAYRDEVAQKSIRSFGSGAQKKRTKTRSTKAASTSRRRHRAKR